MEEISGQELSWFFDQWLNRTPSPSLEGSWFYNAGSNQIEIEFAQTQPGDPYILNLELGISEAGEDTSRIVLLRMTEKSQRFQLAVEGAPRSIALDPNTWALIQADFVRRN